MPITLISFNIFHGGLDESTTPSTAPTSPRVDRISTYLQAAKPDIVILTELNNWTPTHLSNLASKLSHDYSTLMDPTNTPFRIGLTSRFRILTVEHVHNGFHHGALVVKLDVSSRPGASFNELQIVGTHLTPYLPSARVEEARQLAKLLTRGLPAIIAGDLNALSPHDSASYAPGMFSGALAAKFLGPTGEVDFSTIEALEACGLVDLGKNDSFDHSVPTRLEVDAMHGANMRLDYAFATAELVAKANVVRNSETDSLSDHYPLQVTLEQ
ncbi:Endonuclease/exonuclease/phosphatase [Geranomyces variabilis]|nr:Endonuclease/exonuclease/phosphatase [Geranomyces variabilis]KAJ3140575.1 hypothetical protein HDU90_007875 [Geranomyces variabilis]